MRYWESKISQIPESDKIGIALVTYKQGDCLASLIHAIKSQTFKNFKIYKDSLSKYPDVKIKRSGLGKICEFRTKMGEFSETGDSIRDLLKQPCTNYLIHFSLDMPKEEASNQLLSHYKNLLKHHEFKNEGSSYNATKHEMEKKEINRIKQGFRKDL